jgi:hypothetical protein
VHHHRFDINSTWASDEAAPVAGERFRDLFEEPLPAGTVVGSAAADDRRRGGVDAERVMSIRGGALRIQPLVVPGWCRAGLAYGPFTRRNGLAMAAAFLNADNGSGPYRLPSLTRRLGRWLIGSGETPVWRRLLRFPRRWRRQPMLRRLACWRYALNNDVTDVQLGANWAVGWFPAERPKRPHVCGQAWVGRGAGPENGHLLARSGSGLQLIDRQLTNVPLHLIVVLREQGAAYYLSSFAGAGRAAGHPFMRPLAIDVTGSDNELWAGIHQSALGEIGFSTDTVVSGVAVADIPALSRWFGSAHAADRLAGAGDLVGTVAEVGGRWSGCPGGFRRTAEGAIACGVGEALLRPDEPSGLIHLLAEARGGAVKLLWRHADAGNTWSLYMDEAGCRLEVLVEGVVRAFRSCSMQGLRAEGPTAVQISDDGNTVQVSVEGELIPDLTLSNAAHAGCRGVGIGASEICGPALVRRLEAHPRVIPIPPELLLPAPWSEQGGPVIVDERFDGPPRPDLDGYQGAGGHVWRKLTGIDAVAIDGDGARVLASLENPVRRRLAYGIDWPDPDFADVETTIVPPAADENGNCHGRGGLIFWQDPLNFLTVNTWLDTRHTGGFKHCGAVSSFFTLNGFEDIYDAVWTNLAGGIRGGEPCVLRIAFDGNRYRVHVDGKPVLYRALSDVYPGFDRLKIRRVGILSNWEWGHDTGSRFLSFIARSRNRTE